MAPAWQASGTIVASTGIDITPVNPAHVADDILVLETLAAHLSLPCNQTCLTPSGWTLLAGPVDAPGGLLRSYWFWVRATSGAMTNPLCDWSATGTGKYAVVHNIRGAITTGNPFAAQATTTFGATDPAAATGVTTTEASQYLCSIGCSGDNLATAVTITATDPATWTARNYQVSGTGDDAGVWMSDATRATVGATGNVSHDFNAAPLKSAILIAAVLAPAGAPARVPYTRPQLVT
jgi:hypothetical protein